MIYISLLLTLCWILLYFIECSVFGIDCEMVFFFFFLTSLKNSSFKPYLLSLRILYYIAYIYVIVLRIFLVLCFCEPIFLALICLHICFYIFLKLIFNFYSLIYIYIYIYIYAHTHTHTHTHTYIYILL